MNQAMTLLPPRKGARDLEDLRQRCVIDELTGCWDWGGALSRSSTCSTVPTTRVWLPDVNRPGAGQLTTASRAAWLLSGRKLQPDQVVFRHHCGNHLCINPAHAVAVTRPEMHALNRESGRFRGDPKRAAANRASMLRMALPVEKVRQAEAMLAAGVMSKDIRAELGFCNTTMTRIRSGKHPHSRARQNLVRGASVFTLGAAA